VDAEDTICAVEVVAILASAAALWPLVRRVKGPWLREGLLRSVVLAVCAAPLLAVMTRDPLIVAASVIIGPVFGMPSVLNDMQMQKYLDEHHARYAEMKQRRDGMRALFRRDSSDAP
jgi:hypothetical protein